MTEILSSLPSETATILAFAIITKSIVKGFVELVKVALLLDAETEKLKALRGIKL